MISRDVRYSRQAPSRTVSTILKYPKTSIVVGALLFMGTAAGVLGHTSTYNVALASMPAQQVIQINNGNPPAAAPKSTVVPATRPLTQTVERIFQLDPNQYASKQQYDTYGYSACSAAAITEYLNAYSKSAGANKTYHIGEVLDYMTGMGYITADQGLMDASYIDRTMEHFGFATTTLSNMNYEKLINLANSGQLILVNFPPDRFTGGHFVFVKGGDLSRGTITIVDSSKLNMTVLSRATFEGYWNGFAKAFTSQKQTTTANGNYSLVGKPTVTPDFINKVLANAGSPAAGKGQAMYDLGVKYGIDPVFALAFFQHESNFGTHGEAQATYSLGNLRCIPDRECIDQDRGGYAKFNGWEDGFECWYRLIHDLYITQWGRVTVDQIIPKYAPSGDNNDEAAYISSVKRAVDNWHAGNL